MAVVALLADDLTGASDAGVQFARRGLETMVCFEAPEPADCADVQVVALDTDTRHAPPDAAYETVRGAAKRLRQLGPEHVYKKVDSTLRGNLGAEIDAVMDAFDLALAVVAPAFPRQERTTVHGVHYLRGVPVSESEIGRDARAPVAESNLVHLLGAQSRRSTGLVDLSALDLGAEAIRDRIEQVTAHGARVLAFDASSDEHLAQIVEAVAHAPLRVLWVGSAGLAKKLAEGLALPAGAPFGTQLPVAGGPVLVVVGSLSSTAQEQAATVRAAGIAAVQLDVAVAAGGREYEAELSRGGERVAAALERGQDVMLTTVGAESPSADAIADALGHVVADAFARHPVGGFVLTGGDTARAVCRRLDVTGIRLLAEVEPGVPLGRLEGGCEALAVTKAGAFGSADTLVRALRALKGER